MASKPKYKRVLLKLSGEALGRGPGEGLDLSVVKPIAGEIASVSKAGVQLAVVIGGGNLVRGGELIKHGLTPALAHTMGMMATVVNGLALHDLLKNMGVENRLQTAIPMESVAERYIRERCIHQLDEGRVVILAAGTGSPFFTTDTAAALRAREGKFRRKGVNEKADLAERVNRVVISSCSKSGGTSRGFPTYPMSIVHV